MGGMGASARQNPQIWGEYCMQYTGIPSEGYEKSTQTESQQKLSAWNRAEFLSCLKIILPRIMYSHAVFSRQHLNIQYAINDNANHNL
jgi:hypothetical protein